MGLEDKIKELEQKLALKQAYLSVSFTFPRGNGIPKEIKDQVTTELKKACAQLAEHEEYTMTTSSENGLTSNFTQQETQILKDVAASIVQRSESGEETPVSKEAKPKPKPTLIQKKARILMLDSIDKTIRNKIEPQSEIRIIGTGKNGKHFVETLDDSRHRFWVATEDLDFNV